MYDFRVSETTVSALRDRDAAINAAAWLISDDLPHWTESEYVRGMCELIADTFGGPEDLDADQWRQHVWSLIADRVRQANPR